MSSDLSVSSSLFVHLSLSVYVCLFLSVCLSAHIGVVQLAGRDTLTTISAKVHRAVHTLADLSDCSNSKAGCLLNRGKGAQVWVSTGGCFSFNKTALCTHTFILTHTHTSCFKWLC